MLQYFPQEGIIVHAFIHSKNIHLAPSTFKGFVVDIVEDTNESDTQILFLFSRSLYLVGLPVTYIRQKW